eukprot:644508-Prorocentrum_minimum.AAC.1
MYRAMLDEIKECKVRGSSGGQEGVRTGAGGGPEGDAGSAGLFSRWTHPLAADFDGDEGGGGRLQEGHKGEFGGGEEKSAQRIRGGEAGSTSQARDRIQRGAGGGQITFPERG